MKISVILCTYNGEKYIQEQLNSIINQSVKVDEIVVCDDHSSDQTVSIVSSILSQNHIDFKIIENKENIGVSKNFVQALNNTTADIVYFSDQDDIWFVDKVKIMNSVFKSNSQTMLVCTDAILINNQKETIGTLFESNHFSMDQLENGIFKRLMKEPFVTGATMAIRKELFLKAQPFSKHMLHDQWLSYIAANENEIEVLFEPLIYYRQHNQNVVGAGKKKKIKKIVNENKNKLYGKDHLLWFIDLKEYLIKTGAPQVNVNLVKEAVDFWQKRTTFYQLNLFEINKIIKHSKTNDEYCKYSMNMNAKYELFKYFMQLLYKKKGR